MKKWQFSVANFWRYFEINEIEGDNFNTFEETFEIVYFLVAWVTLQLSGKLLVCGTMAPFKCYEQISELVKMHPCLYNKQEKDFKKEEVKQRACKEIAKEVDLEYGLSDVFYIDVEARLMMPEAVNDVFMPSLCFCERIFSSKFGDNISLVGMSWR